MHDGGKGLQTFEVAANKLNKYSRIDLDEG